MAPRSRKESARSGARTQKTRPGARRKPKKPATLFARVHRRYENLRWWWKLPLATAGFVALALATFLLGVCLYYGYAARRHDISDVGRLPHRSVVFDRHGEVIGRLRGPDHAVVSLDEISPWFVDALVAREDSRFFRHRGIDFFGVARAFLRNVKDKDYVQGASTITMQLARNSYLDQDKNLHRKLVEIMLARRIENEFSKHQILTSYCNRVFFGTGIYGIDRAARAYFHKSPAGLSLSEGAMLAGIIRAPNRFSPFRHYERALHERDTVLDRMETLALVTADEVAAARRTRPAVHPYTPAPREQETWTLNAVRQELDDILDQYDIEDGGLAIHTTLDRRLQATAEQALEHQLRSIESTPGYTHRTKARFDAAFASSPPGKSPKPDYLQGALVAVDNETGGIIAIVGGRDTAHTEFNRALRARRQIGSTFKPFVYSAAFEKGLMPGTLVDDSPIRENELARFQNPWNPRNADHSYNGFQPASRGLIQSRNTMSVRVGSFAGIEAVIDIARRFSLAATAPNSPQTYIGNLGVDLKTLTAAYSAFPNEGILHRPFLISRIERLNHPQPLQATPVVESSALSRGVSWMTSRVLQETMRSGTGKTARQLGFTAPAGGKTGTTDNYTDAWFVGYTSRLTCGVWVGLDKPRTIVPRAYGSRVALPVWVALMRQAQVLGYPPEPFSSSLPLGRVELCKGTGLLAAADCRNRGHAYTTELPFETVPRETCTVHGWTPDPVHAAAATPSPENSPPNLLRRLIDAFR